MEVRRPQDHLLTAYDHTLALLLDQAGIDVLLVGDSLGTVVQGRDSTLPVTLEQSLYHTEMVARAARRALVVGDLPFLSYQASVEQADPLRRPLPQGNHLWRYQARRRPSPWPPPFAPWSRSASPSWAMSA